MRFPRCAVAGCQFTATHAPTVVARLCDGRTFEVVLRILLCHDHGRACEADAVLTPRSLLDIQDVLAANAGAGFEVESLFVRMDRRPVTLADEQIVRVFLSLLAPVGGRA